MKVRRLERVQRLPVSRDAAWAFFSDPSNLSRITPPELGFEVTSPLPSAIYAGAIVRYRVRPLFGVPVTWVTEITHVRSHEYFVDEQRIGPYRLWHHEHHFRDAPGGVEMRDVVHYALPFGPLGFCLDAAVVGARVARIFDYRQHVLAGMFASQDAPAPVDAPDRPPPPAMIA